MMTDGSRADNYHNATFDSADERREHRESGEYDTRLPKQLYSKSHRHGGYDHDRMYDRAIDEPMTISPHREDHHQDRSMKKHLSYAGQAVMGGPGPSTNKIRSS